MDVIALAEEAIKGNEKRAKLQKILKSACICQSSKRKFNAFRKWKTITKFNIGFKKIGK